jgi:hypothetical protein
LPGEYNPHKTLEVSVSSISRHPLPISGIHQPKQHKNGISNSSDQVHSAIWCACTKTAASSFEIQLSSSKDLAHPPASPSLHYKKYSFCLNLRIIA